MPATIGPFPNGLDWLDADSGSGAPRRVGLGSSNPYGFGRYDLDNRNQHLRRAARKAVFYRRII
jgi:hypothetical protein